MTLSVEQLGSILVILSALPATLSVLVHSRVRWWRSGMGVHLMVYMGVIAALLDLGVLRIFWEDTEAFRWLRLGLFACLPPVLWWRLLLQVQAQRWARAAPPVRPCTCGAEPADPDR